MPPKADPSAPEPSRPRTRSLARCSTLDALKDLLPLAGVYALQGGSDEAEWEIAKHNQLKTQSPPSWSRDPSETQWVEETPLSVAIARHRGGNDRKAEQCGSSSLLKRNEHGPARGP